MKIKKFVFVLALMFIFGYTNVKANTIYSIDVDVNIDKEANAMITETWKVKGTDGTEWYHPFRDLQGMTISDFTVSMDGRDLQYKTWNINESLSKKAGYYGMNFTNDGVELCFGKGDFNEHTFVLKYTVSNFVFNTDDAQVTYWTFFPKFQNVDFRNFSVNIRSYYAFPDTLDVWGYGYKGYAYVKDGIISLSNSEDSSVNDAYVVLLAKYPLNTFNTSFSTSKFNTFDDVLDAGNEGTFKYDYGESI